MSLNLSTSSSDLSQRSQSNNEDGGAGGKKKKRKLDLPIIPVKNTADYQRMKLQRLMANPDKPVMIPNRPKEKSVPSAPDFVRNVMGSSAGAGSGEFHVYRHLRRKEYARQKTIIETAKVEEEDAEFQRRIEQNKIDADEKTAKKRAKRQKKKLKAKQKAKSVNANSSNNNNNGNGDASDASDSDSDA